LKSGPGEFGLNRIRQKLDAFLMRHQMRCPKRNVKSEEKALELVNLRDPSATGKAFDEAFEWLMQAAASRPDSSNSNTSSVYSKIHVKT